MLIFALVARRFFRSLIGVTPFPLRPVRYAEDRLPQVVLVAFVALSSAVFSLPVVSVVPLSPRNQRKLWPSLALYPARELDRCRYISRSDCAVRTIDKKDNDPLALPLFDHPER